MHIFPTLIWGSPTPDRAVNSIEWADLRGYLTLDVKICTFNVKFGLFWVCSVTLRQFLHPVWILRKSGWLLCISMHMQQLWGDGSVDQGNLESSTLNEGWRKNLVAKLCKFGEILKLLHLVLMLWNWHHCWMMRSVRKCWQYMHDFVHKPILFSGVVS